LRCSRVLAAHSTVGPTNPDLEARWELAIKTVNQAGNTATTPAPGSTGLPAGPSLIYHASHRPMTIKPYRRAIQDRLRRRREAAGAPRLAPTSAEIAAHYATLPHPPSIKDASDLCGFTPTQHIQFTLLALVVLREGAQRCQLTDSDGHRALWDAVISDINRVIGAEPVYLLSQGVAGAPAKPMLCSSCTISPPLGGLPTPSCSGLLRVRTLPPLLWLCLVAEYPFSLPPLPPPQTHFLLVGVAVTLLPPGASVFMCTACVARAKLILPSCLIAIAGAMTLHKCLRARKGGDLAAFPTKMCLHLRQSPCL